MKNEVIDSFDVAVRGIQDGATIMVGGFGPPRLPENLMVMTDLGLLTDRPTSAPENAVASR
ncbi:MAG: hypothetical protein HOI95_25195 [Chromatiales bacterium]|jgi:hypothetical protein|nr:hypothetical protein [Chromatiales bacterium]